MDFLNLLLHRHTEQRIDIYLLRAVRKEQRLKLEHYTQYEEGKMDCEPTTTKLYDTMAM